nr:nitroreductase/quinone reductase family protein [Microlunatus panaciterrae]
MLKAINALHHAIIRLSGGRLGWTAGDMPVVELTTTGRHSGQPRTVLLTSPLQLGSALVVVASRGGSDQPPDWLLNLQADPHVSVRVGGGPTQPRRARVASPAERARLWQRVVAGHRVYAGYQQKTDREIALVLLEPPPAGSFGPFPEADPVR